MGRKEMMMVIVGSTLVLVVPGVCALSFVAVETSINDVETRDLDQVEEPPPIVTLEEYDRVQMNMSYQQVVDIIGEPGIAIPSLTSPEEGGAVGTTSYLWRNPNASNMKATFQTDQLVTKAQLFLE